MESLIPDVYSQTVSNLNFDSCRNIYEISKGTSYENNYNDENSNRELGQQICHSSINDSNQCSYVPYSEAYSLSAQTDLQELPPLCEQRSSIANKSIDGNDVMSRSGNCRKSSAKRGKSLMKTNSVPKRKKKSNNVPENVYSTQYEPELDVYNQDPSSIELSRQQPTQNPQSSYQQRNLNTYRYQSTMLMPYSSQMSYPIPIPSQQNLQRQPLYSQQNSDIQLSDPSRTPLSQQALSYLYSQQSMYQSPLQPKSSQRQSGLPLSNQNLMQCQKSRNSTGGASAEDGDVITRGSLHIAPKPLPYSYVPVPAGEDTQFLSVDARSESESLSVQATSNVTPDSSNYMVTRSQTVDAVKRRNQTDPADMNGYVHLPKTEQPKVGNSTGKSPAAGMTRSGRSIYRDCQILLNFEGCQNAFGFLNVDGHYDRLEYVRKFIEKHYANEVNSSRVIFLSRDGMPIKRTQEREMIAWNQVYETTWKHHTFDDTCVRYHLFLRKSTDFSADETVDSVKKQDSNLCENHSHEYNNALADKEEA